MQKTYTYPEFAYRCSEEQRSGALVRHPVVASRGTGWLPFS